MSTPTALSATPSLAPQMAPNPFVGPQSIDVGQKIYGRDRELRELRSRLIADRLVLMYSPSGAGKTSLINAGLRPELEDRGFAVLPTIRVNRNEARAGARNPYMVSTLLSLCPDQGVAELQSISLGECIDAALATGDPDRHPCLIFDQFEEVLTADADEDGQELRREFLAELGVALRDKRIWALFSMREDYVTQLDPYLRLMPTQLQSHFRLELLTAEQAKVAAIHTALSEQPDGSIAGLPFDEAAATTLVDNLRTVMLDRGDGPEAVQGVHVEPVHLQVVCRRLWEQLPANTREIGPDDVRELGDVDEALQGFYGDQVRTVAAATAGEQLTVTAKEREIRLWIEDALISDQALRKQSDGRWDGEAVDPAVLRGLGAAHLIRREERGTSWYELAHDRLVRPVMDSNEAWRTEHLGHFQRSADMWRNSGRSADQLLRGKALREAKRWSHDNERDLLAVDREYLDAAAANEQSRASGRWARILAVAVVLLLVAVGVFVWRSIASDRAATRAADTARAFGVARQSRGLHTSNPALALAVAAESTAVTGEPTPTSLDALAGARANFRTGTWQPVHDEIEQKGARRATVSPDGTWIVSGGCPELDESCKRPQRGWVTVRPASDPEAPHARFKAHDAPIVDIEFYDDETLVTAGEERFVRFWDLSTNTEIVELRLDLRPGDVLDPLPIDQSTFRFGTAMAFDPTDPDRLVTGDALGRVWLWDLSQRPPVHEVLVRDPFPSPFGDEPITDGGGVNDIIFRQDGKIIASAESSGDVLLWDVSARRAIKQLSAPEIESIPVEPARKVAFAPEPESCPPSLVDRTCLDALVVGHEKGAMWYWENPNSDDPRALPMSGHTQSIESLSFGRSASGLLLASSSGDRTIRLWSLERLLDGSLAVESTGTPLTEHSESVDKVQFFDDGRRMVSSSPNDGSLRLWAAPADVGVSQLGDPLVCGEDAPTCFAQAVAFGPDGRSLVSTGADGVLRVWNPQTGQLIRTIDAQAEMFAVAVHPRENIVVAAGDGRIVLWDIDDAPTTLSVLWTGRDDEDEPISARTVAFDEQTGHVATADDTGTIRLWDIAADDPADMLLGEATVPNNVPVDASAFGDAALFVGGNTGAVWALPFDGVQLGQPVPTENEHDENVRGVALGFDGRLLATASRDQSVVVADLKHPEREPLRLLGHRNEVGAVAFTGTEAEDGAALLASASNDGTIRLWWLGIDAKGTLVLGEDEPLPPSDLCRQQAECFTLGIAFSDDGTMLASASSEGLVHVWHMITGPTDACRLAEGFLTPEQLTEVLDAEPQVCFQGN